MSDSKWLNDIKEDQRTKIIKVGNCTVILHRPTNLSDEERCRIVDQICREIDAMAMEKERAEKEIAS